MRKRLIAAVGALACALLGWTALALAEPTPPPVANIVTCSGVGLVSETVQAVECSTDAVTGTSKWNSDYSEAKVQAKAKHDSPPVAAAAGWSSNGPLTVGGNQFCVTLKADAPHDGPSRYAVLDIALSWDGVQQPTITFPLSHGNVSYCVDNVPPDAQNFFWEAVGVTGASEGDAKIKIHFAGVSFATLPEAPTAA